MSSPKVFAGELGPSTIVGSAAFNLFIISAAGSQSAFLGVQGLPEILKSCEFESQEAYEDSKKVK